MTKERRVAIVLVLILCAGMSLSSTLANTGDASNKSYHTNPHTDAAHPAANIDSNADLDFSELWLDTTNADSNFDPLSWLDDELSDALHDAPPDTRIDYNPVTGTVTVPDLDPSSSQTITETSPYLPDGIAVAPTAPVDSPETLADTDAEVPEALPDAPFELNIVPRNSGLGCIVYGIPISTSSTIVSVTEASDLFAVPEGGSIGVFDEYVDPTEITDGPFATGQMIQITDSSGEVAAWGLTVVRGDVTGSGMMNLTQLVRESRALNGAEPLEGLYLAAGDLTGTGEINLTDMVQMAAMFQTAE